ncbi:hypothetical protein FM119_00110 [Mycetocola reblochoni REB411]|uniref:Uncharacterized protein n=1 Tax=Mycetocola reblochoni REB411 TaxID=1255698 RepID=A0A1R4I775_9MICO|nr:hypothetical protein FM119_00110 [Mycetocola reblochoni REB411]
MAEVVSLGAEVSVSGAADAVGEGDAVTAGLAEVSVGPAPAQGRTISRPTTVTTAASSRNATSRRLR